MSQGLIHKTGLQVGLAEQQAGVITIGNDIYDAPEDLLRLRMALVVEGREGRFVRLIGSGRGRLCVRRRHLDLLDFRRAQH